MKVIQLLSSIQAESDGVANCGRNLSVALGKKTDLEVHVLDVEGKIPTGLNIKLYHLKQFPKLLSPLNGLGISPQMSKGILSAIDRADILHTHSLWMMQTYYAYKATKSKDVKLCMHIHGTLSPWALQRSKLKKRLSSIFLKQRKVLERADLLIASCEDEYNDIRNYGLKNPVAIITNGIEIPNLSTSVIKKEKTLVFLSRIHPKKGIDILLKSWKAIQDKYPDWNLQIAGNDSTEYAAILKNESAALQCERVKFTGELRGNEKHEFLANASLFALPTHSENFGIAVGEALACGTPVITTTGAPWSGLVDNDCGLWIELSVDNLTRALEDMMSRPLDELSRMGENGREWMKRDFSWDEIARKTIKAYEWLLSPEHVEKPDWIYTD